MAYDYATEKPNLFTDDGQRILMATRDASRDLIKSAGAFSLGRLMDATVSLAVGGAGTWPMMAAVDRLIEMGELVRVNDEGGTQYWLYSTTKIGDR